MWGRRKRENAALSRLARA